MLIFLLTQLSAEQMDNFRKKWIHHGPVWTFPAAVGTLPFDIYMYINGRNAEWFGWFG